MLYCLVLSVIVVLFLFVFAIITYLTFEKSGWFSLLYIPYLTILLAFIFYCVM